MSRALIFATLTAVLATTLGCAGRQTGPIVDTRGVDPAQYRLDLAECGTYADQVAVGQQAATGAVAGAVVGGLVGAAVGGRDDAGKGATAGAVVGGAKGTAGGLRERDRVVKNCLRHRGYAVLN